jgi:hypothetical protein
MPMELKERAKIAIWKTIKQIGIKCPIRENLPIFPKS